MITVAQTSAVGMTTSTSATQTSASASEPSMTAVAVDSTVPHIIGIHPSRYLSGSNAP